MIVNIFATVQKAPSRPEPPTAKPTAAAKPLISTPTAAPAAPLAAPDLLAIGEFPDPSIVSTGGWVWRFKNGSTLVAEPRTPSTRYTWVGEPQRAGRTLYTPTIWEFDDPGKGDWASETRVRSLGIAEPCDRPVQVHRLHDPRRSEIGVARCVGPWAGLQIAQANMA